MHAHGIQSASRSGPHFDAGPMGSGGLDRDGDKERVRDASDIVRVVGEHLTLHPKGREFVGLCPFHDDSKPSMYVVPGKQIFHCFACGAGGDVFSFVQKYHGMEFGEALKFLAERGGIELSKRRAPEQPAGGVSRRDVIDANAFANRYFRAVLEHETHGEAARALIEKRQITPKMVERFELGASTDNWEGLSGAAIRRAPNAPTVDALALAGVVKKRDQGTGSYDMLRDRLIFPIHDQVGRVIAFGGRRLGDSDESGPKYLNSPETPVFHKSKTLYGLHQASRAIQRERTTVVVEGYMDVVACHQAGVETAVATLGTALTAEHAQLLKRLCDRVVLLFDGDEAGQRAADRALEVFFSEPIDVAIATLGAHTDAKDPDELLKREGGREVFDRVIAEAQGLFAFRFEKLKQSLEGRGAAAVDTAVKAELRRVVDLGLREMDPIRQTLVVRELARAAGLSESEIRTMLPAGRSAAAAMPEQDEPARRLGTKLSHAEAALGCVLLEPKLGRVAGQSFAEALREQGFEHPDVVQLARAVADLIAEGQDPGLASLLNLDLPESVREAAVGLEQRLERETDRDATRLRAVWDDCIAKLHATVRGGDAQDLQARIAQAGAGLDAKKSRAAFPGLKRK